MVRNKNDNIHEASTSLSITVQNKNDNIHEASTNQIYIVKEKTTVNDSLFSNRSFEELLLSTMKQAEVNRAQSKRKLGLGGSVITTNEAMQILKESDKNNKEKEEKISNKKLKKKKQEIKKKK